MSRNTVASPRRLAALVVLACAVPVAWTVSAAPGQSDRALTTSILHQVASAPSASPVARPIAQARKALDRAQDARASGDEVHAVMLEGLALEWAELAQDILRASDAERAVDTSQAAAASASIRVQRSRAMLEELAARKARASAQMQELASKTGVPTDAAKPASKPKSAAPRPNVAPSTSGSAR